MIADNYAAPDLGLDRADLLALARNSFAASFLDEADKARHIAAVDRYGAGRLDQS